MKIRWLLGLLGLLTACQSHPVIPAGDPGQVVAHFEFVGLPDGKGDTLKCITYSLKNESQYDYYILWPGSWGLSLTTHLGDTSSCNAYHFIGGFAFYRLSDDLSRPYIDEKYREHIETVLRPYLLEQRQYSDSYLFPDSISYNKMRDKLHQRRINKILRATSDLTKSRRERILDELKGYYVDFEPVLLKSGSSAIVGIFSELTDYKKYIREAKIPADTSYTQIYFKSQPAGLPSGVHWVFAEKVPEPPLYTTSMKPVPKLWYYDPEPCSKYKSYYPYLGQVICRDTIIVPTKYLWE